MYNIVTNSLDKVGFASIQYEGYGAPLAVQEIDEIEKTNYRVDGFDAMFGSPEFRTITFIRDLQGLKDFLETDICKRYVSEAKIVPGTTDVGIIKEGKDTLRIMLNTEHDKVNKFKLSFIGKEGNRIQKLSEELDCKITLRD